MIARTNNTSTVPNINIIKKKFVYANLRFFDDGEKCMAIKFFFPREIGFIQGYEGLSLVILGQ